MTDTCESCLESVDPGNHLELEYPEGAEPELLVATLCDDCARELADHPILERVRVGVQEVTPGGA